jgi:hypothetical protein
MIRSFLDKPFGKGLYLGLLIVSGIGLVFLAILLPDLQSFRNETIQAGDVALAEERAPYALVFESEVLTEIQRDLAENSVQPIFSSVDTSVARLQLEQLRAALAFISSIRADRYATVEQKLADLTILQNVRFSYDTAERLLLLSDSRWQAVQQEAILVLERVMRETIHDDRLEEARRRVPASVSLSLPEDQASLVAELVSAFVAPNSFYNAELTQNARQQARLNVQPVQRTFAAGEIILSGGRVVTAMDLEALEQYGILEPQKQWEKLISAALLSLLVFMFFVVYLRRSPRLLQSKRAAAIFVLMFGIFVIGARLITPGHTVLPYLYPTAAFGLTAAVIFSQELALISTLPLAVLVAYGLPNALDLTLYTILSSFFGVLTLRITQRLVSYLWTGLVVAVSGMGTVVLYRLTQAETDVQGLLTLMAAAGLYGLASSGLSVVLQYFLAQAVRRTTPLQLIELSRPDHPLLQEILRQAPGTYQHSLQVANLAEQAAERIGADGLLVKVGALYHDAGKIKDPQYFIENQLPGNLNPHNELDPVKSAKTIIAHVKDGLELAQQYRLPRRVQDFIAEHHGSMLTLYQYTQALQAAGGDKSLVKEDDFRYPGPRPQSRETAVLMLADGCEARVRAEHPKDEAALKVIIGEVINNRIKNGQLDLTSISLKDLNNIIESFVTTLRGMYHPRIEYPRLVTDTSPTVPRPPLVLEAGAERVESSPQEGPSP